MPGLSSTTLRPIPELEHVEQSVRDILLTPIGSRVHRRGYGCAAHDLVDGGTGPSGLAAIRASAITALSLWEPRLTLSLVSAEPDASGSGAVTVRIEGTVAGETLAAEIGLQV